MTVSSSQDDLFQVVAEVLGIPLESVPSQKRGTDPWDSLKHLEVVFAVEDEFELSLTEEEISAITSATDLIRLIEARHAS